VVSTARAPGRSSPIIIILGPDHSGKTTLAKKTGLNYYHFDKNSRYDDYLKPLTELFLYDAVLDRFVFCEFAYSHVMSRDFAFTMKEWHNLILLALIQKPAIILCTHKPTPAEYSAEQYLPYGKWDACLASYKLFFDTHHIPYIAYDYARPEQNASVDVFLKAEAKFRQDTQWWKPMWEAGYGAIGSTYPKVLLVAERIGPNNMNNIPFETGPTGLMLSEMFTRTKTPLGKIAVTNLVKSFRRDPRPPNQEDLDLLKIEIENLRPDKVVFMGAPAKQGIKVAKELDIPHVEIAHLGYYHHKGITDMSSYYATWKKIMGMVKDFKLGEER